MTEEELKARLIAAGWEIRNICAIKYLDCAEKVLNQAMPEIYAITKLSHYELFVGDVDNSVDTNPGMLIFDYTCWNSYIIKNPDFEKNAEILCSIENLINDMKLKNGFYD
jgi:hypothetical protein